MSPSEEYLALKRQQERAAIVAQVMSHRDAPVRHRKRRSTFVQHTGFSPWPLLWAVFVLLVLIVAGMWLVAYAVLTKGAI